MNALQSAKMSIKKGIVSANVMYCVVTFVAISLYVT